MGEADKLETSEVHIVGVVPYYGIYNDVENSHSYVERELNTGITNKKCIKKRFWQKISMNKEGGVIV